MLYSASWGPYVVDSLLASSKPSSAFLGGDSLDNFNNVRLRTPTALGQGSRCTVKDMDHEAEAALDSPSSASFNSKLQLPLSCDPPSPQNPTKQRVWVVSL